MQLQDCAQHCLLSRFFWDVEVKTPDFAYHDFWATRFYACPWLEFASHREELISQLYALRNAQSDRIQSGVAAATKSGSGIYESDFDLLEVPHPSIQSLRDFIAASLRRVVAHVNDEEVTPDKIEIEFRDSWYHITNDGGFHDAHVHGGCSWCGIFYVQIGDSGQRTDGGAPNGGNRFYSPHWSGGAHNDYGNKYLGNVYIDPPIQDGMLLLFPSYLKHSGLPYCGEKDRIIISFNSSSRLRA